MPNGIDKNFGRLAVACASFRAKYGEWPTEARVAPMVLWDFGQLFDLRNFELLCSHLRFRTTKHAHIAVGNAHHHVVYENLAHPEDRLVEEAWTWLGARVRPELAHLD